MRTIHVECRDPADCDVPAIEAALRAVHRATRELGGYEARLVAELKARRNHPDSPLVRDLLLGEQTRTRSDVKKLDAAADAVTKIPSLRDTAAPLDSLAAIGNATRGNPQYTEALTTTPEGQALVEQAATASPDTFKTSLQQYLADIDRQRGEEDRNAQARYARRAARFSTRDDGDLTLYVNGPHDSLLLLQSAVDLIRNRRWCAEHPERAVELMTRPEAAQLNYDALIEIAEQVLAPPPATRTTQPAKNPSYANRRTAPAIVVVADLTRDTATTADGHPVPRSTLERLSCTANLYALALSGDNVILDMAHKARFATTEQYLALLARDRTCGFKGCRVPGKYCIVHHMVAYPAGPTDIANLCLLCDRHHHVVHEGGWRIDRTPTGYECSPPRRIDHFADTS